MMDGRYRDQIDSGQKVAIVTKSDQKSGKLTVGNIQRILTKSHFHPHGIKVQLTSGEIGRVKQTYPETTA